MRRRERGSVFVLSLAVLTGLVALVAALASMNAQLIRAESNRMQDRRARLMLESGVQRAIAELQTQDPNRATLADPWAKLGEKGDTEFSVGGDTFRLQILEDGARIDVNAVDEEQLKRLPLTQAQIHSILDWRDALKVARAEGAKDDYYNTLARPYNAKLAPFDRVEELLMVKDFTPAALYSSDRRSRPTPIAPDVSSDQPALAEMLCVGSRSADQNVSGRPKLDLNTATAVDLVGLGVPPETAQAIIQARSGTFQKLSDALRVPQMTREAAKALADNATVGNDAGKRGLINVNTASEAVLRTIPNLEPDDAAAIISRQGTGFKTLGEILDVPGVDVPTFVGIVDRLCVGSRAFTVRVIGQAGGTRLAAEAQLVIEDDKKVRVARWQPQVFWTVRNRWGWEDSPARTVELGMRS